MSVEDDAGSDRDAMMWRDWLALGIAVVWVGWMKVKPWRASRCKKPSVSVRVN